MFDVNAMLALRDAQPFVPFRFHQTEGGAVEVPSRRLVLVGRNFAVVGATDPPHADGLADRWTTVWYALVARTIPMDRGEPGA